MAVNPALIGGGVVVAAAAVGGGLYAGGIIGGSETPQESGSRNIVKEYRGPAWKSASEDKKAAADYTANTYADKYKKYLVAIDPNNASNDEWWQWSFNSRYTGATKTQNKGFASGINDAAKLKEACQKAYKGSAASGTPAEISENGGSSAKYPETEVWLFCSPSKTKIQTLKEVEAEKNKYTDQNSYGKAQEYEEKLVSTEDAGSEWFWELKEEEFFNSQTDPTLATATNSEFKKLWKGSKRSEYKKNPTSKLIKELCKTAYNTAKPSEDNVAYPKSDVGKFCTLSGEALS